MSFRRALNRHMQEPEPEQPRPLRPPRDWYSASGTGWGAKHDKPNPFAKAWNRLKQDFVETGHDLREEPGEVPYRLKKRLDWYIKGGQP